jgi:hypothetical protein
MFFEKNTFNYLSKSATHIKIIAIIIDKETPSAKVDSDRSDCICTIKKFDLGQWLIVNCKNSNSRQQMSLF